MACNFLSNLFVTSEVFCHILEWRFLSQLELTYSLIRSSHSTTHLNHRIHLHVMQRKCEARNETLRR